MFNYILLLVQKKEKNPLKKEKGEILSMKKLKKVLLTSIIALAILLTMQIVSNAATVKITGEVVNIRKEASTDSKVVAQLSENVECEYLGEEGNWYKVKYQRYTGYVSKEYTKLIGETNSTDNNQSNNVVNNQTGQSNSNTQQNNSQSNVDVQQNNDVPNDNEEGQKLIYKKFSKKTTIKILPLIHASNIGEAKKDDEVLILTETSGWSYIQTDEINGWVRTDTLGQAITQASGSTSSQGNTTVPTEKSGYISEEEVNMRKGAGTTYSVVKVLTLNTKVTILKEEGKWYKVKVGNSTGYVSKDYVSDSKNVTNRSLTEPRTINEDSNVVNNDDKDTTNKAMTTTTSTNKVTNASTKNTNAVSTSTTNKVTTGSSNNENNSSTNKNETTSKDTTKGTDIIAYAKSFMGVPYVWGGASKSRI